MNTNQPPQIDQLVNLLSELEENLPSELFDRVTDAVLAVSKRFTVQMEANRCLIEHLTNQVVTAQG
jgi:type III secretion system FlhB-like substrate exporter